MSPTIFLSTVTCEFGKLRKRLASLLEGTKRLHVRHQDDFVERGVLTLQKLQEEVEASTVVFHVIGAEIGYCPPINQVNDLLNRLPDFESVFADVVAAARSGKLSYTQWELWLAAYYGKRPCVYKLEERVGDEQSLHLELMLTHQLYAKNVVNEEGLFDQIILSLIELRLLTDKEARKIIHLPYQSLGTLFKGRDEFLKRLHDSLIQSDNRPAAVTGKALHGLGGVGKTRLAVEYAWQHADEYSAVLFVTADSPQNLKRNLAELVGPMVLNLDEHSATDEEVRVAAALRWLVDHPGWFLILDNVDDESSAEMVERLLPKLQNGHVVITSRLGRWRGQVHPLELDVLSVESAVEFLLERTKQEGSRGRKVQSCDAEDAFRLANLLDGLALALEQAGAYIVARRKSFTQYIELWRMQDKQVQEWHNLREMQYPRSVATTWETTLEQLSDDERSLMNLLAWFDPALLPVSIFDQASLSLKLPPSMPESGWDKDRIEFAIVNLADFSMIQWQIEAIAVHRVVQEVIRSRQESPRSWLTAALIVLRNSLPVSPKDKLTWPAWDALMPHILFITSEARSREIDVPTVELLSRAGEHLLAKGHYIDAEPLLSGALTINENSGDQQDPKFVLTIFSFTTLLCLTNRHADTEPYLRWAIEILENQKDVNNSALAFLLTELAMITLRYSDQAAEATRLFKQAEDVVASNLFATGDWLFFAGERLMHYAEGRGTNTELEPLLQNRLHLEQILSKPDRGSATAALNSLAVVMRKRNRLDDAEATLRKAFAMNEELPITEMSIAALGNLASVLTAAKRVAEAELIYRRALSMAETVFGTEHPQYAFLLLSVAKLLRGTDRVDEAVGMLRVALAVYEKSVGGNHIEVAHVLKEFGNVLGEIGQFDEAEVMLGRALDVCEKSQGKDHCDVGMVLKSLCNVLRLANRHAEAVPLMRRALAIDETLYGADDIRIADDLNTLACLYYQNRDFLEAEILLRRAIGIFNGFKKEVVFNRDAMRRQLRENYGAVLRGLSKAELEIYQMINDLF